MNVCHFEYEHDMKLVGGFLLLSRVYQYVFLCISLFSPLHGTVSKYGFINMFFSLYFLIYGFINVFSFFVFSYFHPVY